MNKVGAGVNFPVFRLVSRHRVVRVLCLWWSRLSFPTFVFDQSDSSVFFFCQYSTRTVCVPRSTIPDGFARFLQSRFTMVFLILACT